MTALAIVLMVLGVLCVLGVTCIAWMDTAIQLAEQARDE